MIPWIFRRVGGNEIFYSGGGSTMSGMKSFPPKYWDDDPEKYGRVLMGIMYEFKFSVSGSH